MSEILNYNPQPARPAWGVRAPPRKQQSIGRPIINCPLPAQVALTLDLGPGGLAKPVVEPGTQVDTGQLVAISASGSTVHASLSGTVRGIMLQPVPGPAGSLANCLMIESDCADRWHEDCRPAPDPFAMQPAEVVARIAAGGIAGLGGALFPTAGKLQSCENVSLLILNGAECEPYISCDETLLRERPADVIRGARIMMHAAGVPAGVIAVETDMPEARVALHDALAADGITDIGIAVVTAKYPAGGERQLIELLTGREVPANGLPRDVGILCQNVATAAAVAALFDFGRPLVSRLVTVTGNGIRHPGNFEVRIGTPMIDLITAAGGYVGEHRSLVMGGPMMGFALPADTLPVTSATNCLLVAAPGELVPQRPEYPCIRCAECSTACPARLLPQELLAATRRNDTDAMAEFGLDACIECGCCDYVCPSQITLTPRFIAGKQRLREIAGERQLAEQARALSERRERRLAKPEDSLADAPADADTALAALMERVNARHPGRTDD